MAETGSGAISTVVIGAGGGIGAALVRCLAADPATGTILACSRRGGAPTGPTVEHAMLDYADEATIEAAAERAGKELGLVLVATGLLHDRAGVFPERDWRDLDGAALARLFAINAIGPALVMKHFLPRLSKKRRSVMALLSARVGSIADNRLGGWYGYRASKAALNQLIHTAAIELARKNRNALVVGLHPGTVATGLSQPFRKAVPPDALKTPDQAARELIAIAGHLDPADSGGLFAWDGSRVEP